MADQPGVQPSTPCPLPKTVADQPTVRADQPTVRAVQPAGQIQPHRDATKVVADSMRDVNFPQASYGPKNRETGGPEAAEPGVLYENRGSRINGLLAGTTRPQPAEQEGGLGAQ